MRYTEWTASGVLRHPVFLGVREDKRAEQVVREEPRKLGRGPAAAERVERVGCTGAPGDAPGGGVLTNPERVYRPDPGVTKRELARWYEAVADRVLPELARRPLTLFRCPEGREQGCFYQRHPTVGLPPAVRSTPANGHGDGAGFLWIEDLAGLYALAQIGALELHPWGARLDDLDRPDRLVFDLDPGPEVPWDTIVAVAERVRAELDRVGLRSFVRLTGGAGVHVVVPLRPHAPWAAARPFCRAVAERLAAWDPARVTTRAAKEARGGKVYVDWLRNGPTNTAVASWSPRARPGAPVATPLTWEALPAAGAGSRYTLRSLGAAPPPDPWGPLDAVDQRLDAGTIRRVGT